MANEIVKNEVVEETAETTEKFSVTLKKPVDYNGKSYDKLSFDFGKLRGQDSLDIENELMSMGKVVIVPSASGEYLIRLAAKACTEPVGSDIFTQMSLSDYNTIRSKSRTFLLELE